MYTKQTVAPRAPIHTDGSEGGYCATLGAIKAAIAVFGLSGVFANLEMSPKQHLTATLRNGRFLALDQAELDFGFKGDGTHGIIPGRCGRRSCTAPLDRTQDADTLQDWITLYFAFAAKSLQLSEAAPATCRHGIEGFRRSFEAIRNGFANKQSFALLGLEKYTFDDPDLDSTYGMLWTPKHVMFYGHGMIDRWGTAKVKRFFAITTAVGLSASEQPHPSATQLTSGWDPFVLGREDTSACSQ